MSEKNRVELGQDTLEGVAGGGLVDIAIDAGISTVKFVAGIMRSKKKDDGGSSGGGGTPTKKTSEPPVTPTANPGGPNYNNDNRGGKQMNVQMGKNVNSSSGNKM